VANHKVMAIFNKAPYERISVVEGTRALAGLVTMGTEGIAVFISDGVYALLKNQNPTSVHIEPILNWLRLLETNRVPMRAIWESLFQRGIRESDLLDLAGLEVINSKDLAELMLSYNSVFVM